MSAETNADQRGSGPCGYLTMEEFCAAIFRSRIWVEKKVASGEININKLGRTSYFPPDEPKRLLEAGFRPAVRTPKQRRTIP